MAKELYVGQNLTSEMILAGKQLISSLEIIMPITISFWLYTSEAEAWRLYIVTPRALTDGIRNVYDAVLNVLETDQKHEYTLPLVCVYPTDDNDNYVSSLRMVHLSNKLFDRRLTGIGINGSGYIEDAYIYRLYDVKNDDFSHSQSPARNEENAIAMA